MKSIIRSCTSATHWILSHVVIHVTFEQNILSHYCTLSIYYFLRLWWLWNKGSSSFSLHVCRGTRPAFMASSVEDFQASSLTVRWKARADNEGSLITGYRMIIKGDTRERQCEDHWSWYKKKILDVLHKWFAWTLTCTAENDKNATVKPRMTTTTKQQEDSTYKCARLEQI